MSANKKTKKETKVIFAITPDQLDILAALTVTIFEEKILFKKLDDTLSDREMLNYFKELTAAMADYLRQINRSPKIEKPDLSFSESAGLPSPNAYKGVEYAR